MTTIFKPLTSEGDEWCRWGMFFILEVPDYKSAMLIYLYRCLAGHMAMHACQIGPTDTAPPCLGSPQRACVVTRGGEIYLYVKGQREKPSKSHFYKTELVMPSSSISGVASNGILRL